MTNPVYFTVEADYRAVIQDAAGDGDYDPQIVPVTATVTFTPLLDRGSVILATGASPRPIGFLSASISAIIDVDGRLKLRAAGETGNPDGYTYTPVRLLANSPLLELATPLFYSVTFSNVTFYGKPGSISGFEFEAPNGPTTINLIELAYAPGVTPTGVTKIAPGGVRTDGDNIIFTFAGADIPNPIPKSIFTGATGDKGDRGDAATIAVGDVATGAPGTAATVTNAGTANDAVFDIQIPRGDVGPVGDKGDRGDAATITVGTVDTVAPEAPATITNTGTTNDAVLDFEIPQGIKGDKGDAATITVGTVDTVAAGAPATVTNTGTANDAVLDIEIPQGVKGDQGDKGDRGDAATITVGSVLTGSAGTSASVTNVGTATDAVFDIQIPRGDKGETGDQGVIGLTGDKGDKGDRGDAATITVGTVSTGSAGSSASFTNVGDLYDAVFDVSIPRGDKGETGNTGQKGDKGDAASVAIGTVTTLPAGSSASVTNVGTSSAAVFDIAIPKGDTGSASNETWTTLADKPAVIAAGATKADARTAIDAEYTGARGVAGGIATLDSAGKVPYSQLPASIMSYQGTWSASGNTPTLADGTGDQGDVYRVSVAGTVNLGSGSIAWGVGDYVIYNGTVWEKSDSTDAVASVNGYTGVISLTKSDVGLSAVDNTADADKPVSTATSTALSGKEPTITAGSAGQYWTGSKTWATLNAAAVSGAEATANKDAANGYAGLDASSKLAIANIPTGTTSSTVAIGDDSRITGAEQSANKGTASGYCGLDGSSKVAIGNLPTGTTSSTVAIGNDSRITGAEQTANKGASGGYAGLDSSAKVAITNIPTGTTSTTACIGDDARLSDARTPTAHTQTASTITDFATAADARISAAVGSTVQAYSSMLTTWAGKTAPSGTVVGTSDTQTLTNKRVTLRVGSTTSSATPSIDTDSFDQYNITALAAAITSVTVTGTPTDGQKLLVRIKDNGTARAIAWGSSFLASGSAALPTTTVISKTHLVGFIYDSVAAKWVCVAADATGY